MNKLCPKDLAMRDHTADLTEGPRGCEYLGCEGLEKSSVISIFW